MIQFNFKLNRIDLFYLLIISIATVLFYLSFIPLYMSRQREGRHRHRRETEREQVWVLALRCALGMYWCVSVSFCPSFGLCVSVGVVCMFFYLFICLFVSSGLRTLVLAYKELTDSQLEAFRIKYEEARRHMQQRERRIRREIERLEQDLILLGLTGVEDKLQEVIACKRMHSCYFPSFSFFPPRLVFVLCTKLTPFPSPHCSLLPSLYLYCALGVYATTECTGDT